LDNGSRVNREVYARFCERLGVKSPGPTYRFVKLRGEPYLLWRAADERGTKLDVLLQKHRDKAAARRFFTKVLRSHPCPGRSSPTSCAAIYKELLFLASWV
jgi:transposase-like protein